MERTPSGQNGELPRQDRTKYKLADSIKECMKTTPVDKITVKDIVERCGLTRQTFYRNFKDKYDLINWYFDTTLFLTSSYKFFSVWFILVNLDRFYCCCSVSKPCLSLCNSMDY